MTPEQLKQFIIDNDIDMRMIAVSCDISYGHLVNMLNGYAKMSDKYRVIIEKELEKINNGT